MEKIWVVLGLTILLFPAFVWADCGDLGRYQLDSRKFTYHHFLCRGDTPKLVSKYHSVILRHYRLFASSKVTCVTQMRSWSMV